MSYFVPFSRIFLLSILIASSSVFSQDYSRDSLLYSPDMRVILIDSAEYKYKATRSELMEPGFPFKIETYFSEYPAQKDKVLKIKYVVTSSITSKIHIRSKRGKYPDNLMYDLVDSLPSYTGTIIKEMPITFKSQVIPLYEYSFVFSLDLIVIDSTSEFYKWPNVFLVYVKVAGQGNHSEQKALVNLVTAKYYLEEYNKENITLEKLWKNLQQLDSGYSIILKQGSTISKADSIKAEIHKLALPVYEEYDKRQINKPSKSHKLK